MYGYEEHVEITPEQLLQKISQQRIFEFALQQQFSFNLKYNSPFREHSKGKGTCRFEQREDGTILFVDFGDLEGRTHRSCFRMIMDVYSVSLSTSIKIIAQHFKISLDKSGYKEVTTPEYQRIKSTSGTDIGYTPKAFNKYDIQHWSQFLIRPEHLLEDNVFSVSKFTINGEKGYKIFNPYKYCYAIDFVDAVKIYQPYSIDYKWITNCNENHIGNIDNLPATGDELIIQKSYKDHRVLRNLELDLSVIWFGNEGCIPSMEIIKNLMDRFKLLTIFYDNDLAGTKAAMRLVSIFNEVKAGSTRMVHLPNYVDRKHIHKDPSQFIHKEGRVDLTTVVKQILYE
jgi:hypothetical protein